MKRRNIIWLILLLLVVALLVGGWLVYRNLPGMITPRVKQALLEQLNPPGMEIYRVEMNEVIIDRHRGVLFTDILIKPLDAVFTEHDPEQLPKQLYFIKVDGITVGWNDIISLARDRSSIIINNINIPDGRVTLYTNNLSNVKDSLREKNQIDKIQLNVSKIALTQLEQRLFPDTAKLTFSMQNLEMEGRFSYHPQPTDSISRVAIRGLQLISGIIDFLPDSSLYTYHLNGIKYSQNEQILHLDNFRLTPLYNKTDFQKFHTYRTDRIEASLQKADIYGFDPHRLINHKEFFSSEILINIGNADIFRDKNLPPDTLKRTVMPTRLIRETSVMLNIEKVTLENFTLTYSELPEGGDAEGIVPFKNLYATITNITNIPRLLSNDSILQMNARALLFDSASLNANFMYNLLDMSGGFRVRGEVAGFDFTQINSAIYPLAGYRIAKGVHTHSTFQFTGNDISSKGEVVMLYSDLVIDSGEDSNALKKGVLKFLGRNLVYHSSNPGSGNSERTGTISFERNLSRSVFHYWWHSYLTGIKNSVLRDVASGFLDD